MIYALVGLNVATIIALVVVAGRLIDFVADREHAHDQKVTELCVRIQAPDSPQVTMLPRPDGERPRRKLFVTEDDEIARQLDSVRQADELLAGNA